MDKYFYIILIFFIIIVFIWIILILKFTKKKTLNKLQKSNLKKLLKEINLTKENRQKIIDYDKLYHKILREMWYDWDFGSILKTNPKEIKNIDKIWDLHRLRNKLVHDFEYFWKELLSKGAKEYKTEIEKLLK